VKNEPPVENLVVHFDRYLSYYEAKTPFAKPAQLRTHTKTMDLRRQLGTASAALADERFLNSLAETLGLGVSAVMMQSWLTLVNFDAN
jgi:hypothetical protein